MKESIVIPDYTQEDFLSSTEPFEFVYGYHDNKLKMKQIMTLMSKKALLVGIRNFIALFQGYVAEVNSRTSILDENTTDFTGQEIELQCGDWICDDLGVRGTDKLGFEIVACNHPIMPVQRLVNIDTGVEKLRIAYRKSKQWRTVIVDKKTLASNNSILALADVGVAVNSENSRYLVKYLTDIEHLNYDAITELNAVSRLGWIEDYGFSPYVDSLVFDGDLNYKHYFESVSEKGDFDTWMALAKLIRTGNVCTRLLLSASFSSVLVQPCGALPFFVHLWGGTETGKTVGLMFAASVWADPTMGNYIHSFNSTSVAQELSATFVNSMPLILDELQIVKDRKDFDNMIYNLSEGVGRSRGQKTGGIQKVGTWQNCILTTGEMPISTPSSGGGSINRIIEIDCKEVKLFEDARLVADTVKQNYGFAGKMFVEKLSDPLVRLYATNQQKQIYKDLCAFDTTDKQALAASIILTADKLIDEWIFKDGQTLSIKDIEPYLSSRDDVSQNLRALEYLRDYIFINQNKFTIQSVDYGGEVWGASDNDYTYIIKSQFDKIFSDAGFNSSAFLSWAICKGYIVPESPGRKTKNKKINGRTTRCIWLKNGLDTEEYEECDDSDLPFEMKNDQ